MSYDPSPDSILFENTHVFQGSFREVRRGLNTITTCGVIGRFAINFFQVLFQFFGIVHIYFSHFEFLYIGSLISSQPPRCEDKCGVAPAQVSTL